MCAAQNTPASPAEGISSIEKIKTKSFPLAGEGSESVLHAVLLTGVASLLRARQITGRSGHGESSTRAQDVLRAS